MENSIKYAVGLMSGTSLDGIDAALVKIEGSGENIKVKLIEFINEEIPLGIKNEIRNCCSVEKSNVEAICSLNFKLGYIFSEAVEKVCKKANFNMANLDFIGSHGQTIYHIPKAKDNLQRSTLQIGEPAVIAYNTKTTVVSDFRTMDMAAGGEGAPLVPYTEYLLYRSSKNRVLQNIGGIGNATVIPRFCKLEDIYDFDTGPGNMIIDELTQRLKGEKYDKDGRFAAEGTVQKELLNSLMNIGYIHLPPPKTTGREIFGSEFVDKLLIENRNIKAEDMIATVTMFTAKSIAENYRDFIFNKYKIDEIIISGGGSYNKTLVKMLQQLLPNCNVLTGEDIGISSDAKEAVAFAVLANETLYGNCGNVIGATGARERVILGNITLAPRRG